MTSFKRNKVIKYFLILIFPEVISLYIVSSLNDAVLTSIFASILSGTIIGVFVTYSQAKISASIYEEGRVMSEHLNDIKGFMKGKKASDLAEIMIRKESGHSRDLFMLNDVEIHWPDFSLKLKMYCKNEEDIEETYRTIDNYKKALQTEQKILKRVLKEIENNSQNNEFLMDFFQPGVKLSHMDMKGSPDTTKNNKELVESFYGFLFNQISSSFGYEFNPKESYVKFQSKFHISLTEDIDQFETCRLSHTNDCPQSVIASFWKAWASYIKELTSDSRDIYLYELSCTNINDLTEKPEFFISTVREAIEYVLKTERSVGDIIGLYGQVEIYRNKKNALSSYIEKEATVIENSYYLKNRCELLNQD